MLLILQLFTAMAAVFLYLAAQKLPAVGAAVKDQLENQSDKGGGHGDPAEEHLAGHTQQYQREDDDAHDHIGRQFRKLPV